MSIRERVLPEFDGHSKEFRAVIRLPLVQDAAQNIEINDWHLYPFYTSAWLEGYFTGNIKKLTGAELSYAHAYLQRVLNERHRVRNVSVENNINQMIQALESEKASR